MNLGLISLWVCTNEQPNPERIGEISFAWLPGRAVHQPLHQLMGDQLKSVGLGTSLRKKQLAGRHLQWGMATLPAQLKGMPVHTLPWTDPPKLAGQQGLQSRTKILLSGKAAAVGREQGQEGSIRHGSGHQRAVAHKDGPS